MKIISDGTIHGTQVFGDDGEAIGNVVSVRWEVSVGKPPRAVIEVILPEIDLTVEGEIQRERITVEAAADETIKRQGKGGLALCGLTDAYRTANHAHKCAHFDRGGSARNRSWRYCDG
ncbi:MAG: hypothetical protein IH983_00625 [Planctomycetes bacterium]|nr:hypothetical protein [Planctomycetota bacterium]